MWRVRDYLPYWLEEIARPKVRDSTYAKYETFVRVYLVPSLGPRRLDRLSTADVRQFLKAMSQSGKKASTVRVAYAVLRAALEAAVREELVFRNVAAMVDPPRVGKSDLSPWSADEARRFLSATRGSPLYGAYVLVLGLGPRRGEVLGLCWSDVDLDSRSVRVRRQLQRVGRDLRIAPESKSHRRVIPLPRLAVVALRWHRLRFGAGCGGEDLIFTTGTGGPIEPRNFSRSFARATRSAGLRQVRLHDARHGCASLLAAAGVPPRVVMEILGTARSR